MTKVERLLTQIARRLERLARDEIRRIARESGTGPGKGAGHFRTVGEIRTAVARHEVQITEMRRDITSLADMVADIDDGSRRRDGEHRRRGHT